ncbi:MAG: ankyrin repeat domain-containing protein [Candidatus Babeliales bacterium]
MNKSLTIFLIFLSISLKVGCSEESLLKKTKLEVEKSSSSKRTQKRGVKRLRQCEEKELSELIENKKIKHSDLSQEEKNTELLQAFKRNNIQKFKRFLKKKADPNTADEDGNSLIFLASKGGNTAMLKLLLMAGGCIETPNIDGLRPLHVAAKGEKKNCCYLLLQYGANFSAKTPEGNTALNLMSSLMLSGLKKDGIESNRFLLACKYPNPELVSELVGDNADVNQVDKRGRTGLMLVAKASHIKRKSPNIQDDALMVINHLLNAGIDPSKEANDGTNALTFGSEKIKQKIKNYILRKKRDIVQRELIEVLGVDDLAKEVIQFAGTWDPILD